MTIKIATWNVNSVRARLPNLLKWLSESKPDVVLLQEIKTVTDGFPFEEIEDLGYNTAVHGQKTYNGVAVLSKFPIDDIVTELPDDENDEQARYIEVVICPDDVFRVASVYVPNGTEVGSDNFRYKMDFFDRLKKHTKTLLEYEEKLIIGGDFNVAPEDIDVYDPKKLKGRIGFHPDEQRKFRSILHLGMTDVFRTMHPTKQEFSWWDYRHNGFHNNRGMRLDQILLSPQAADTVTLCRIDKETRILERPSDHAPMCVHLSLSP